MSNNHSVLDKKKTPISSEHFLKRHFKSAFNSIDSNFFMEIRLIKGDKKESILFRYPEIEGIWTEIKKWNENGWDVFFGVNPRPLNKQKKELDIVYINCLWVDVDVRPNGYFQKAVQARQFIESFPHKPSCIVDSGKGFHCYWYFKEPFLIKSPEDRKKVKQILSGLIKALNADKSGKSLERVMRLPGTLNHKYGKRCEIVEWNYEKTSNELFD